MKDSTKSATVSIIRHPSACAVTVDKWIWTAETGGSGDRKDIFLWCPNGKRQRKDSVVYQETTRTVDRWSSLQQILRTGCTHDSGEWRKWMRKQSYRKVQWHADKERGTETVYSSTGCKLKQEFTNSIQDSAHVIVLTIAEQYIYFSWDNIKSAKWVDL